MKLVEKYSSPDGGMVKIYHKKDWDEYVVKWYNHIGSHFEDWDYHTDCLQDAKDTAVYSIENSGPPHLG